MSIERIWETPLRSIAKFSESLIHLEFLERLSYRTRKILEVAFWGYHFIVLALFFLERSAGAVGKGTALFVAQPLIAVWGIFALLVVCIYLPCNALNSLYGYLRRKELPPSHSLLISILTAVGAVTLLYLARS